MSENTLWVIIEKNDAVRCIFIGFREFGDSTKIYSYQNILYENAANETSVHLEILYGYFKNNSYYFVVVFGFEFALADALQDISVLVARGKATDRKSVV